MSGRKDNLQKFTSWDPLGPALRTVDQDRKKNKAPTTRRRHPMPELVACDVDGRSAWRAVHGNGMVQTVVGTKEVATRRVRAVVDRLNAFEEWCRRVPTHQRIELL
jgi:hypothetical protein